MSETTTVVLPFGEAVQTSLGLMIAEIDPLIHSDSDGNVLSRFRQNTPVTFLIHHDPAIVIVRVLETEFGHISGPAVVQRSGSKSLASFTDQGAEVSLSHIPQARPSAKWYGRQSQLTWDKNKIKALSTPCLGDISYTYQAKQYRYTPPTMGLAEGAEYPVDIVVEYRGAS